MKSNSSTEQAVLNLLVHGAASRRDLHTAYQQEHGQSLNKDSMFAALIGLLQRQLVALDGPPGDAASEWSLTEKGDREATWTAPGSSFDKAMRDRVSLEHRVEMLERRVEALERED